MTQKFTGFPPGRQSTFSIPSTFISELLPLIEDVAELKVTLYALWAVQQREGRFRYLRRRDFANNPAFMAGLAGLEFEPGAVLDDALASACERKTLLCAEVVLGEGVERLYFINTELGRTAVEQIERGNWQPGDEAFPVEIMPERPNIYRLYEANIGPLTPMIAEALRDAEHEFPAGWLEEAVRIAVHSNARSWRFIQAILDRWQKEGKRHEVDQRPAERDGRRHTSEEYVDLIGR